jgi:hypothetical protein
MRTAMLSMGWPVLTAMYERAIRLISPRQRGWSSPEPTRHHSHAIAVATGHASLYWYQEILPTPIKKLGRHDPHQR